MIVVNSKTSPPKNDRIGPIAALIVAVLIFGAIFGACIAVVLAQ